MDALTIVLVAILTLEFVCIVGFAVNLLLPWR